MALGPLPELRYEAQGKPSLLDLLFSRVGSVDDLADQLGVASRRPRVMVDEVDQNLLLGTIKVAVGPSQSKQHGEAGSADLQCLLRGGFLAFGRTPGQAS